MSIPQKIYTEVSKSLSQFLEEQEIPMEGHYESLRTKKFEWTFDDHTEHNGITSELEVTTILLVRHKRHKRPADEDDVAVGEESKKKSLYHTIKKCLRKMIC